MEKYTVIEVLQCELCEVVAVLEEKNQRKPVRRKRIQEEPAGEEKIRIEAALKEPKPAEPVRRKRVRKEPVHSHIVVLFI